MTNVKNVFCEYKCGSLSNCGTSKTDVSNFWLLGGGTVYEGNRRGTYTYMHKEGGGGGGY